MRKSSRKIDEPPSKRPKVTRGEDDYMPGNIIELELRNFMTYEFLRCKPGSRLNLVIGPNGSGKSSIVCAIGLCLGGEPSILGRIGNIGGYVKHGEESGHMKISLRGNTRDEQIDIMRKIYTSNNRSEWFLNERGVTKKEISEIIQRFNIQVNNLTQFLPQEKVCKFAKLTPVELLKATEQAVGDPQLPIQHNALVEKSSELKDIHRALERNGDTLSQLKGLNAELEKEVERVRQREELFAKVETMQKKLPWLEYDLKKSKYMVAKEKEKDAKKKVDEAAKNLILLREPIEKQNQEKAMLEADCRKISNVIKDNSKRRLELLEKENHLGVQVQGKYKEMEDLRRQEASRQERILKAKEDLAAAETELQNLPIYEAPKGILEQLTTQISELRPLASEKRSQKLEKGKLLSVKKDALQQCLNKLKDMENANNKRLMALRNSGADKIYDAYNWVQQHRHELNNEVYGPVLLEVNISDRVHADYLEGHVPYYIWKSFITQDPRDRDFLVRNLKSFDVPILNYVRDEHCHKESFHVSDQMHQLGIYSRLDHVFDAPDAVKEVMISQFGLEKSYIGSKETDKFADEVAKLGILDFWTPENHYRWSVSRYGGHVSASVEPIGRSQLLFCSLDGGEIEKLRSRKEELEASVSSLEGNIKSILVEQRHLEDEEAKLHKQREEIVNNIQQEKKKRRDVESLINLRKRKLGSIEKEDKLDTRVEKLTNESTNLNSQRIQCAINLKELLVEAITHKWSYGKMHMASIEFDAKIRELEVNLKQHERLAHQVSVHLEYCKKEVEECRQELSYAKRHAESIAIITPELEKAFVEMPTTIEELKAAIQDTLSEANSIHFLNHNILKEYEHRQEKIETISRKLEADKEQLKRCIAEIDLLKDSWLPTLRNLVAQINDTFSRNFKEMAVAGEVSLDEHEEDFDKFGILIKVKFRQTGQLQVLSAEHQSGGERSVSTILYLVSLQDLTNCPFRVVDEINQGMDLINERKMFQHLVKAASRPNTPQCFLITPKLLPDLEYSEACSILNVMTGPWIKQPSEVWKKGDCWGTIAVSVGRDPC
ncbi:hypothetical protein K2173_011297 [Erythroxylum novogranatense]|uniref:Structural maintenance of chromosomes protein 5 n=1 Tax=Erythroxylum novogranatense TaxID=1862640 RepID=A0AAV8S4G1_9ROSI|nr:hypothetical protein K2173_011297 [Erythroxylum novogranatense]